MRRISLIALSVGAALLVGQASAQDGGVAAAPAASAAKKSRALPVALQPQVAVSIEPSKGVVTGDVIKLKLKVKAKTGTEVAVPDQSFAPFELIDQNATTQSSPTEDVHHFELSLLALEPGTHTVPGVKLRIVAATGELGDMQTEPQTVSVSALLANEPNAEPKPVAKPVAVMEDDYRLAWAAGALVFTALIALATLLISRWIKRRPKPAEPPPPPRAPWDVAMEKLLLLEREKQSLIAENRAEEFIDRVGDALREYLGRRYGFDGLESTTDEVLNTLQRIRPHKLSLSGVSLLLEQCDLVKFARVPPDLELCDELWNGATGLVRATTPIGPLPPQDVLREIPEKQL